MKNSGFTLVEVIVVAVIVGVLAAVSIPMYQGYVDYSSLSVAESVGASLSQGIQAAASSGFTMNPINWGATMVSPTLIWPEGNSADHATLIIPAGVTIVVTSGTGHDFNGSATISYRGQKAFSKW